MQLDEWEGGLPPCLIDLVDGPRGDLVAFSVSHCVVQLVRAAVHHIRVVREPVLFAESRPGDCHVGLVRDLPSRGVSILPHRTRESERGPHFFQPDGVHHPDKLGVVLRLRVERQALDKVPFCNQLCVSATNSSNRAERLSPSSLDIISPPTSISNASKHLTSRVSASMNASFARSFAFMCKWIRPRKCAAEAVSWVT